MSLTLSGNEITQAQRTAALLWGVNQQGGSTDGLGLYENRLPNGSFEVNTAGWAANGLNTIARSNAVAAVDGVWCALGTYNNGVAGDTNVGAIATGTLAAGTHTVSAGIYMPSAYSGVASGARPRLSVEGFAGITGTQSTEVANIADVFQLVSITFTLSGASSGFVVFRAGNNGAPVNGNFFYFDAVMLESGATAHAYVNLFGVAPAQGFSIWEAGTNLFPYGQFNAAPGANANQRSGTDTGSTFGLDTATPGPFSPNSFKVNCAGVAVNGPTCRSNAGLALAAGTNAVGSVYFRGTAGRSYKVEMDVMNTDASETLGTPLTFVATGARQLVVPPSIVVATGKTGDRIRIDVYQTVVNVESLSVFHPMLQAGVAVVSPYIATSGGVTATRNAARVQSTSRLLNATQSWFACRVKMGFPSTLNLHGSGNSPSFLSWLGAGSDQIVLNFNDDFSIWHGWRLLAGSGTNFQIATAFATGDSFTLFFKWTATTIEFSVNGGTFTSLSNTTIPTTLGSAFDIGSFGGINQTNSRYTWAMCGTGVPVNADAATLSALGDTPPSFSTLPVAAKITMIWPGVASDASDEKEFYYGNDIGVGANTATPTGHVSGFDTATGSNAASLKVALPIASETPRSVDAVDIGFSWFTGHETGSGSDDSVKTEPVQYPPSLSGGIAQRGDGRAARPENGTAEEKLGR